MKTGAFRVLAGLVVGAGLLAARGARADLAVSVTISGPLEELLPLLEQLQQIQSAQSYYVDDGRLEIFSSIGADEAGAAVSAPPAAGKPEAPSPLPAFRDARVSKQDVKPGESVVLAVRVIDPEFAVDTVVAVGGDTPSDGVDLYDNGTHGDDTPRDGTWSGTLRMPSVLTKGEHTIRLTGYDAFGNPVEVKQPDGSKKPLTTDIVMNVR